MGRALVAVALLALGCGEAPTIALEAPGGGPAVQTMDLTACRVDGDCVVTIADCCPCNFSGAPATINRAYLDIESARRRSECAGETCDYAPNERCANARAVCVEDRCALVD